jgi:DNA-binding NarL/FixJ family response regulator
MRILVVDDHSLFRDGLTSLLRAANIEVVGEGSNGEEAVYQAEHLKPEIILMDLHMPKMTGLEALKIIKAKTPDVKIVMLTISDKSEDLIAAIEAGANGYLLKSLDSKSFLENLQRLERGEATLSHELTSHLIKHIVQSAKDTVNTSSKLDLSERQWELLHLLARGLSNREIAKQLLISENTVKYHVRNILQKLNLKNRAEAAVFATQKGMDSAYTGK